MVILVPVNDIQALSPAGSRFLWIHERLIRWLLSVHDEVAKAPLIGIPAGAKWLLLSFNV
jgi:hypothetical protein